MDSRNTRIFMQQWKQIPDISITIDLSVFYHIT